MVPGNINESLALNVALQCTILPTTLSQLCAGLQGALRSPFPFPSPLEALFCLSLFLLLMVATIAYTIWQQLLLAITSLSGLFSLLVEL